MEKKREEFKKSLISSIRSLADELEKSNIADDSHWEWNLLDDGMEEFSVFSGKATRIRARAPVYSINMSIEYSPIEFKLREE